MLMRRKIICGLALLATFILSGCSFTDVEYSDKCISVFTDIEPKVDEVVGRLGVFVDSDIPICPTDVTVRYVSIVDGDAIIVYQI